MANLDIKAGNWLIGKVWGRPYRHLTPAYVFYRLRHAIYRKTHPASPDLTEDSIALLAKMLRPTDIGAEWGSGNSTAWLAQRSKQITAFECNPTYATVVRANLAAQNVTNADLKAIYFEYASEDAMHAHAYVTSAEAFNDNSLDYALVDSAPRGCICYRLINKIKPGGLLILDNANWYISPPSGLKPLPATSVKVTLGYPGSKEPSNICWPLFIEATKHWRHIWTSNGITTTLIMIKTDHL